MAKGGRTGNWRRQNFTGDWPSSSFVTIGILGIHFKWPCRSPCMISASISRSLSWRTMRRVPLQRPCFWFIFRRRTIGWPIWRVSLCGGRELMLMEFRYSVGYLPTLSSSDGMESNDRYNLSSVLYVNSVAMSLMVSTSALRVERIARSAKKSGSNWILWYWGKKGRHSYPMSQFPLGLY